MPQMQDIFLSQLSHELRTPLNGALGFIQLIRGGMADDPEEEREFLQEAYKSIELVRDMVNSMLETTRAEARRQNLEISALDLEVLDRLSQPLLQPLHQILNGLQTIQDSTFSSEIFDREALETIRDLMYALCYSIEELLSLSRFQTNPMRIEVDVIRLDHLLSETEALIRDRLPQHLNLIIDQPSTPNGIFALGYRGQITNRILNLVNEAIPSTKSDTIELHNEMMREELVMVSNFSTLKTLKFYVAHGAEEDSESGFTVPVFQLFALSE
jgi:signal transduction histidine kinase